VARGTELDAAAVASSSPAFARGLRRGDDDPEPSWHQERILPPLADGRSRIPVTSAEAKGHDTQPPIATPEARLIKKLEDLGIGRPSTYASMMKIDRPTRLRLEEGQVARAAFAPSRS